MKLQLGKRILNIVVLAVALIGLPIGVYLAVKPTGFLGRAFGKSANLLVDAGSSYDTQGGVWKNLAQGGEENAAMLGAAAGKLEKLAPEYVRLDHVLDFYNIVGRDAAGNLIFNWTKLDSTLADIREAGAKPFISVSYMPEAISQGNVVDLPREWNDWETAVEKLVEHISGSAGLNIADVYYEVWNEPDLFGRFKMNGDKNYLDLYFHTAVGVARAQNLQPLRLGGPATTGLYENWIRGLLKFTAESSVRLDFISWHRYSKNLEDYENDWLAVKGWLEEYPQYANTELIISEAGINSENDRGYDNNLGAAQTIAVAALLEGDVSRLFTFEIKDGPGPEKYWGRWGMLTHEKWGVPEEKPRYRAIEFLNRMRGKKVNVAGEGSWVKALAKEDEGIIRILVVNYDPSGRHFESVPLTLINLPFKNFLFKRTDFMGEGTEQTVAAETNSWKTVEGFSPNSAAIFEISPI